ncbi:NADPH oxidase family protein, partial [Candidatus Bathyarchaeota archaeon]|nr:NADPH oxidase family protein [Candidatus Bathyarchaeota archaeon]
MSPNTHPDYAHVTKRFGLIAASQLPIQTLLSLKIFNPFARAFGTSHESINRFHRTLGRVIYLFLILHVANYFNLLYRAGSLPERLFDNVVLPGELSNICYTLLFATALPKVRAYSYRLFFITHLFVVFSTSAFLLIHAASARFYVIKGLFLFVLDLAARKFTTATAQARIEAVPGTKLIRISAKLSQRKITQFLDQPGAHAYVSIPWKARPQGVSSLIYEFCFNPFTVADVRRDTGEVVLVARQQSGPMTRRLMELARGDSEARIPLCVEGPYGAFAKTYSSFAESGVDRVLLVAGGVGASFVLPVYKALRKSIPSAKVELTWAVRLAD